MKLCVPIRFSSGHGLFVHAGPDRDFLGHKVRLIKEAPYHYVELLGVDEAEAPRVLAQFRTALAWAAVRLDFGFYAEKGEIATTGPGYFNAHVPTLYAEDAQVLRMRAEGSHTSEEADGRLFSALAEATKISAVMDGSRPEIVLVCELFASIDFESSQNAQFLGLVSILEILAAPAPRPGLCIDLIDELLVRVDQEIKTATDSVVRQGLLDMKRGTVHWKNESIRSSILRLGTSVARQLGDADPETKGKKARALYDKRSEITHQGASADGADVLQARKIVREAIAVEIGCSYKIRERYPTN